MFLRSVYLDATEVTTSLVINSDSLFVFHTEEENEGHEGDLLNLTEPPGRLSSETL